MKIVFLFMTIECSQSVHSIVISTGFKRENGEADT